MFPTLNLILSSLKIGTGVQLQELILDSQFCITYNQLFEKKHFLLQVDQIRLIARPYIQL